jgi:NAD(P)-dependent dehydrogenase (short-subunit alcohol dehydrogenase family)
MPVVIITGVTGGIGLATAKKFSEQGWIVVGTVRGRVRSSALRGMQFDLQIADMLKPRDLQRVVGNAWRTYGRLDALVCNAGYGLVGPIDTLDYAQMSEQLIVNTLAPAELIRHSVPLMRRQGYGVIVGVSSLLGRTGLPGYSLYAASKFALEGMFESLYLELATTGIRVKLVEPSGVNTGFWAGLKYGNSRISSAPGAREKMDEVYGSSQANHGLSVDGVASTIVKAVTGTNSRLRYPLGQTRYIGYARRILPEKFMLRLMRRIVTGN